MLEALTLKQEEEKKDDTMPSLLSQKKMYSFLETKSLISGRKKVKENNATRTYKSWKKILRIVHKKRSENFFERKKLKR